MRKALDQLVLPTPELEQIEHLPNAARNQTVLEAVQPGVKTQELSGGQFFVDEWPIGNEPERRLRQLGLGRQIVAVHQNAA